MGYPAKRLTNAVSPMRHHSNSGGDGVERSRPGSVLELVLRDVIPDNHPRCRGTLEELAPWISAKAAAANWKKEGNGGAAFVSRYDCVKLGTGSALRELSGKRRGGLRTTEGLKRPHVPGPAGAPGRIE
jgi:hypothetical protein